MEATQLGVFDSRSFRTSQSRCQLGLPSFDGLTGAGGSTSKMSQSHETFASVAVNRRPQFLDTQTSSMVACVSHGKKAGFPLSEESKEEKWRTAMFLTT